MLKKFKSNENSSFLSLKFIQKLIKITLFMIIITTIVSCARPNRSWQKKRFFEKKRDVTYNKFVEDGGFSIKYDDEGNPILKDEKTLKRASEDLGVQVPNLKQHKNKN
ncbi:hypothetical protein [Lyticum sinuosum]|uniref:Uncharacterized protein n=1 Tax=Lyticum sinuosum TaxID=1332059 RepID=A0AAE4VKG9_9RICK|nr:hypothetical protein [Lyticum sinuosum]MDZ5761003.1 hypothetical protein [Lyticum sinuosum]